MRAAAGSLVVLGVVAGAGACAVDDGVDEEAGRSAGPLTVFDDGPDAYDHPLPGLDEPSSRAFFRGRALFRDVWVAAPASTATRDGLGPLFNARSCEQCHVRGGRGRPPRAGEAMVSLVLQLSVAGADPRAAPQPHPQLGIQLQPHAVPGLAGEGEPQVHYTELPGMYPDGTPYVLRRPSYEIAGPGPEVMAALLLSPRVAPALIGLGLLEAVAEEEILARADPSDEDGDGISGRANPVWDLRTGRHALGRFGWKASQPTVLQQTAAAFSGHLGITSSLFPAESCAALQPTCSAAPSGGQPELGERFLQDVAVHVGTRAVPARRLWEAAEVRRGERQFAALGCASCHLPALRTADDAAPAVLAGATIRPYTDLLLHDMGEALADQRPDFAASGREWRTPPLWGSGLVPTVNGHGEYLHDGRARSLEEAILWHGGEAEAARVAFMALRASERAAVLAFLRSL